MPQVSSIPTANAAETGAGLTNPNNAHADDGSYATATPGKNVTLATKYQTFGFDSLIPASALIALVLIEYEFKVSVNTSIASGRTYYKVSGVAGSNNDDSSEPLADKINFVNVTSQRSWTRSDLLNGTFEVVLAAVQGNSSNAVTFSFDYVKVTVGYYEKITLNNYQFPSSVSAGVMSITEKIK